MLLATEIRESLRAGCHRGRALTTSVLLRGSAPRLQSQSRRHDLGTTCPATPGTLPPPGTPFDFTVSLMQSGALELKWKCNNPEGTSGTIYEVRRAGTFVGATGVRTFVDETLPGTSPVMYQVTAIRSTSRGNPAQFTVTFGTGGGGFAITGVSGENTTVKMAA